MPTTYIRSIFKENIASILQCHTRHMWKNILNYFFKYAILKKNNIPSNANKICYINI